MNYIERVSQEKAGRIFEKIKSGDILFPHNCKTLFDKIEYILNQSKIKYNSNFKQLIKSYIYQKHENS